MDPAGDQSTSTALEGLSLSCRSNQTFIHRPLDLSTESLRVIKIHPLQADEQVSCSMRHTDPADWYEKLDKSGLRWARQLIEPYACLSYVWGPAGDERDILLNGKTIPVRRNLFDFLKTVARALAEGKEHPQYDLFGSDWWIDALCIDQGNTVEKNILVQRMGHIYYDAENVACWLGDEPEIASFFRRANQHRTLRKAEVRRFSPGVKLLEEHVYWTRAWIVQETHLPQTVGLLAQDVMTDHSALQNLIGGKFGTIAWSNIHKVLSNHSPTGQCTAEIHGEDLQDLGTLLETMWRFRERACFDRRDVVYSVQSISTKRTTLAVDYHRTLPELSKAVLKATGAGICLCQAYIVLHALRMTQDPVAPDQNIPMIEMQGLRAHAPPDTTGLECRQCHHRLGPIAETTGFAARPEAAFVFCLSCKHKPPERPRFTKPYGHLVLLARTTTPTSADASCLYWAPPSGGLDWVEMGVAEPTRSGKGDCANIQPTVAMVLDLIRLIDQKEFAFSADHVAVVAGKAEDCVLKRPLVAQWQIVD